MKIIFVSLAFALGSTVAFATDFEHNDALKEKAAEQQQQLVENVLTKGYGPQSPRDIDVTNGANKRSFSSAPAHTKLNLCNIHFHKNAEHKGGEFTTFAGFGDGKGSNTGYLYSGQLSEKELLPVNYPVCDAKNSSLQSGDTVELHYVFSSADVVPGPTLGACMSEAIVNPQLRVEAQVFVLVNDDGAEDFKRLTQHKRVNDLYQALNIPTDTGIPVEYEGSTTGPGHNVIPSPFKVTWSVRPEVKKVSIKSVANWCENNAFGEDHAHGVRNLVITPELLSKIEK